MECKYKKRLGYSSIIPFDFCEYCFICCNLTLMGLVLQEYTLASCYIL